MQIMLETAAYIPETRAGKIMDFVIKKGTKTCGIAMWQKGSSELFMAWLVIAMLPRSAYRSEIKAMQNPIANIVWKILR
jgi:hypothetical protein